MFDPEMNTQIGSDYSMVGGGLAIVGAREAIVGAVLQQGGSLEQALAAAKQANPRAVGVVDEPYTNNFRKILPIPETVIAASAETTIQVEPQELFKAKRLVIQTANAADFLITGLEVATESQFAAAGVVPGEVFAPNAFDCYIDLKTAGNSNKIFIRVKNTSAGSLTFRGCFLGTSVS